MRKRILQISHRGGRVMKFAVHTLREQCRHRQQDGHQSGGRNEPPMKRNREARSSIFHPFWMQVERNSDSVAEDVIAMRKRSRFNNPRSFFAAAAPETG